MRKALQGGISRRKNKHNKSNTEETIMPMVSTQPLSMARPHALAGGARQDAPAAPDLVAASEAAHRAAVAAMEAQRARAQQEFKRIWNLCTLMQ